MKEESKIFERYNRQIILKGFGIEAQQKLLDSKVLVVGAGGLGCAALQYLAAAGIGTIGIVDDDVISLNNLHRQILYSTNDIGSFKVNIAKEKLQLLNPDIDIIVYSERLTTQNALEIIAKFDLVIDGTDNFSSRYLINDACVLMNKPLIYGAVSQYEGQVAIFNAKNDFLVNQVNYRDLFPQPPKEDEVLNCSEAGVLGVLPGIIGVMQASECIKLITGIGNPLINCLLTYNVMTNQIYEIGLVSNKNNHLLIPANEKAFKQMNYDLLCNSNKINIEIDANSFDQFINHKTTMMIDVREIGELPIIQEFDHFQIPLSLIKKRSEEIKSDTIILFCQSGKRSLIAAKQLVDIFGNSKTIYSLKGGIMTWLGINHKAS